MLLSERSEEQYLILHVVWNPLRNAEIAYSSHSVRQDHLGRRDAIANSHKTNHNESLQNTGKTRMTETYWETFFSLPSNEKQS